MSGPFRRDFTIWNEPTGNRPDGEGRDSKIFRTDFERSGYNIIDSGHFHIDFENQMWAVDRMSEGMKKLQEVMGASAFSDIQEDIVSPIWSILVTQYQEQHSEGYQVYNSFADSNMVFVTGAMPLNITISGFLPVNRSYNSKLDFLAFYRFFLRGSQTRIYDHDAKKKHHIPVGFTMGTTSMLLNITGIKVDTTAEIPDFDLITVNGVGYNYSNALELGY